MKPIPLLFILLPAACHSALADSAFPLRQRDVVVFTGGTEMVELQKIGHLETLLTATFAHARPKFRDLAWEADTVRFQGSVDERWRERSHFEDLEALGDWEKQLRRVGATVILAQYGAMESLAGPQGLESFVADYDNLLDKFASVTRRIVLISPAPFERTTTPTRPNLAERNRDLLEYAAAIRDLAARRGLGFADLTEDPLPNRTINGWQSAPWQRRAVAERIGNQLGFPKPDWAALEPLRQAIVEKHRLWSDYWRPANWKCLFGDDGKRVFSEAAEGLPSFQEEWALFPSLIAKAERQVAAVARGHLDAKEWEPLPPKPRTGAPEASITAETAAFTVPEGFAVNLFADEALGVANPLAIRWDPDGRLYVACTYVYPQIDPGARPDDAIIVLEDTDRDGRADRSTVFAEGLNIPTAMELGDGGVYVGQNTEILFLRDTNGDLKADERTVLMSGFGNGDTHQTINTMVWSPGGELFFCQGDGIESRVETPWGVSSLYGPGAFRLRPQRLQLHGMLNNFMGPGNPWGVAFDDWGQAFVIDGAGGISHLTPAHLPVKRRLKLPMIGSPGGYCGIDVLASDAFPEDLRHDFVMGDFRKNQITRFSTVPDGAGFKVEFESPLLKSSHRNFRPVDVRLGPDDGVYVADFYNPIICHQDDFYRHPIRDKIHGRIWRLAPVGKSAAFPGLKRAGIGHLLDELKSPQRWRRYQAKRLLSQKPQREVTRAVLAWVETVGSDDEFTLLEGLRVLETIDVPVHGTPDRPTVLERLLEAKEPRVRAYATRVVAAWVDHLPDPLSLIEKRIGDDDVRVRMEAALACGAMADPRAIEVLARLADRPPPMDNWLNYAFTQAVEALKPLWLEPFARGEIQFDNPRQLAAVFSAARSKALIEAERKLTLDPRLDLRERNKRLSALIALGEPRDIRLAFRPEFQVSTLPEVVSMTREGVIDRNHPDEAEDLLEPLLSHGDPGVVVAAIELAGLWRKRGLRRPILTLAKQPDTTEAQRHAAIEALGHLGAKGASAYLQDVAQSTNYDANTRWRAIASLCRLDLALASRLSAEMLSEQTAFDPNGLLEAFLNTKGGTAALGKALAQAEITADMALRSIEALVALGSSDLDLRAHFDSAAGLTGTIPEYSPHYITALASEIEQHGDATRGESVFRQATMNCYACHVIHGAGGIIGPDLTAIGKAVPLERLIEEVIWPQRQIKKGYNLVQLTDENGEIISGYLDESQDEDAAYIRDIVTHKVRRIGNDAVRAREDLGSAMPPGLVATIHRQQLRDLIRFLQDLGSSDANADDPRIIRSWEISLDEAWIPFYSRVSGGLHPSDLEAFARERVVTLRPASGKGLTPQVRPGVETKGDGTLTIDLRKVTEEITFRHADGQPSELTVGP